MKRIIFAVLTVLAVLMLSGCEKQEDGEQQTARPEVTGSITPDDETKEPLGIIANLKGTLTKETFPNIDGSTATIPLSEALYQFMTGASAEEAEQQIQHTKTTNSYKRLYNKEADLLIVYEPSEEIVKRMEQEPLLMKPIGLDALVFMANAANTVESLTMEQLVSIYSGNITNWAEVGGADQLLAFQRPKGSGSQTLMQKLVMKETPMTDGDNVYRYYTMSDILEGMLSYNGEDNTLGYSVFYYANNMYYFPELKFMGVDGVLPSTQTIYDGSYKLTNEFYAVIRPEEPEDSNARLLFDWLTGEEGQQMVLDLGYVPVHMPEGASLVTKQPERTETTEVSAHYPLTDGEYFVFFEQQNIGTEYGAEYGNITVYDHAWNVCASFYNVVLPRNLDRGRYRNTYLPVGQIRQNSEGRQDVFYGIYDLEARKYSVSPYYPDLEVLDEDRGYYAVVEPGKEYDNYFIIDGEGKCLLRNIRMEDWLTIRKSGNGYMESVWHYDEDYQGEVISFYDENLTLRHCYYKNRKLLPPEEERSDNVEYHYIGEDGGLVAEDGTLLISKELFLERYGKEESWACEFPFYTVEMEEPAKTYSIIYDGEVYIVDSALNLLRKEHQKILPNVNQIQYFRDFYSGYDTVSKTTKYYSYEDAELTMADGTFVDGVWSREDGSYFLWNKGKDLLVAEEHIASEPENVYRYEYPQNTEKEEQPGVHYYGNHYILLTEATGKTVYVNGERKWYHFTLYYGNEKVCEQEGIWGIFTQDRGWSDGLEVTADKTAEIVTESLTEELIRQGLSHCFVIEQGTVRFAQETPAYLQAVSDGFIELVIGNYTYVYDYDGKQFIKALNHSLGAD